MSFSEGSYAICLTCGTSATCVGVWKALVVYRSRTAGSQSALESTERMGGRKWSAYATSRRMLGVQHSKLEVRNNYKQQCRHACKH